MNRINQILGKYSVGRVLDLGCGRGPFISILKENLKGYKEIIGIDTNEEMLKIAKENHTEENIKFLNIDGNSMDFEDNSFDVVCISNSLHHVPNQKEILDEMNRVLKSKGLFIIQEMFCDNQSKKQLSHVKLHHLNGEIDTIEGKYHNKTYRKQEIVDIAKDLGLQIIEMTEHNTHKEQEKRVSPKEERETLDSIFNKFSKKIETMKEHSKYQYLIDSLNKIKDDQYDVGFFTATELLIVCRKE